MSEKEPYTENHPEPPAYSYFEENVSGAKHHYYLYGAIQSPDKYVSMIHHLFTISEEDDTHIHLNTQGGSLEAGVAIINAMKRCKANIIAHLESQAFSMGSIIFLSADKWDVHDNTQLMIHNYTGESYGKGNELVAHVNAQEKWHRDLTRKIFDGFLTKKEYNRMLDGVELWFHADEIRARLKKMKAKRNGKS